MQGEMKEHDANPDTKANRQNTKTRGTLTFTPEVRSLAIFGVI